MRIVLKLVVCVVLITVGHAGAADEWPQYRGAKTTGASTQSGVFEAPAGVGLSVAWRKKLGSGYSGISVAGGRVLTMFTDGESDIVVAFDERSGREMWRHEADGTEIGHDGSHDGPLSTPLIAGDRVIALGANGLLFAVKSATGEPVWSVDIVESLGAQKPFYGFATSPVLAGNTIVVQVGGDNAAVVGFDPATGKKKWSAGSDSVQYQTPAVIDYAGRTVVLAAGDTKLLAIDPESGEVFFEYAHDGGGGGYGAPSLTPVVLADDMLLLAHQDHGVKAVRVLHAEGGMQFETVWENNSIRGSYNVPVLFDGNVYAFSARFLTCVDAKTGKVHWRSREPGDGFLMLVDGHLVIVTKTGSVHVAKATPDGYAPVAGLSVFDTHAWSGPSFSNGSVFVRSLDAIARIDIGQGATFADRGKDPRKTVAGTAFGKFLAKLDKTSDKRAAVDSFMADVESFPLVERDRVIFVYRGDVTDVAVASDVIGVSQERPMDRVPGTDLFWYALRLAPDTRANYALLVDYEQILDPLNPRRTETHLLGGDMEFSFSGEPMTMSWFAMPEWREPTWLGESAESNKGTVEAFELESEALPAKLQVAVYLPANYSAGDRRYPVTFVHGGAPNALERGDWVVALDNLIGTTIEPMIVVFIGNSGVQVPQYVEYFANELVSWVDDNFRTRGDAANRANVGMANSGIAAFYCTFMQPGIVGKLGTQSAWLFEFAWTNLEPLVKRAEDQPLDLYLDWGQWDMHNPVENWHVGQINAEVVDYLKKQGYRPAGGEVHDGSGWASWRMRTAALLGALFPIEGG